jgi:DNA replication and repair protein RecF
VWIQALTLTDFRSYETLSLECERGVNLFVGPNGQGKTNIVEAIGYLSTLSSHRVAADLPLVRAGSASAVIAARIGEGDRSVTLELQINPGKANKVRINRATAVKARDALGVVRTVVFAPEDLAIVKGDPAERRQFMDRLLVQRTPRMAGVIADYERVLKQRNALLKSAFSARGDAAIADTLQVWDEQLSAFGAELTAARISTLIDMRDPVVNAYRDVAGAGAAVSPTDLTMTYLAKALGESNHPGPDVDAWRTILSEALMNRRREELARGLTLVGPHRDDFILTLGGLPVKGFASHGEAWSVALALRLGSAEVLRGDGIDPIVILDDVFAELDVARRERLIELITPSTQVFITAAVQEDVPVHLTATTFTVRRGAAER